MLQHGHLDERVGMVSRFDQGRDNKARSMHGRGGVDKAGKKWPRHC